MKVGAEAAVRWNRGQAEEVFQAQRDAHKTVVFHFGYRDEGVGFTQRGRQLILGKHQAAARHFVALKGWITRLDVVHPILVEDGFGIEITSDAIEKSLTIAIPSSYEPILRVSDGTVGQVLTTDGAGNYTFQDTASGSNQGLDTTDDVVFNSVSADTFTNTGVGAADITSASTLTLTAPDGVIVSQGPFRLPSFTTVDKDGLAAVNGDMVYDTDLNKAQVYENGAWVSLV